MCFISGCSPDDPPGPYGDRAFPHPVRRLCGLSDRDTLEGPRQGVLAVAGHRLAGRGSAAADHCELCLSRQFLRRPAWLDLAHRKLDEAVFAAYGWDPGLSDEQILEKLLALNLERAAEQSDSSDS